MTTSETVAEFMRHIGMETHTMPAKRPLEVGETRVRMIVEEFAETIVAANDGNIIELADGLADLLYVIVGAGVAYGAEVPIEFISPSITPYRPSAMSIIRFTRAYAEQLVDLTIAIANDSMRHLGDALALLGGVVTAYAAVWGMPLRELFIEVHRSNMSKNPGQIIGTAKYGPGGGKGPTYSPPDIAGILAKAREQITVTAART